jgi:hypothetical protein
MVYRTSQQLIDILLKFGFIETTKVYFPMYWQIIEENIYETDFLTKEELQSIMYSILYPHDYEKYESLVLNPVYLMSYLKEQFENVDNRSQIDIVDYSETMNTISKINLE